MSGLVGFTDKQNRYGEKMLRGMRGQLRHFDSYVDDELFSDNDNGVYGSRTHLGFIDQGRQPFAKNGGIISWLEGEFYNQNELRAKYNVDGKNDNELLAGIYHSTGTFDFLRDVDGYFVAVVYEKKIGKLRLITDRYGFKPLRWTVIEGDLVWASELKGFLVHEGFQPVIDREAVNEFVDVGYLMEDRTWFEGVEWVPPASVLTFDRTTAKVDVHAYWSWHAIKSIEGPIDEKQITEELGRLFRRSVQRRLKDNERVGMQLSGGLDSRAILAAVPEKHHPLHIFTFGREGCDDARIAKTASKVKSDEHHAVLLDVQNWLRSRFQGIWVTDGNMNLLHMHATSMHSASEYMDICLNGLAGDVVLGGSYLKEVHLDDFISSEIVRKMTQCRNKVGNFKKWYSIRKTDPYVCNNRVRRFTNAGTILLAQKVEHRHPFFDNGLIELVYSFSDNLRFGSSIYKKMLLSEFPEYYRNIPWQKTGYPISYPDGQVKMLKFKDRIRNKIGRMLGRGKDFKNYTDYSAWLRREPARSVFEKHLKGPDRLYVEYISVTEVESRFDAHMNGEDHSDILCRYLTFEIWLQQIFNGKYRDGEGALS